MATFRKRNGKWQARIQLARGPSQARTFQKLSEAKKWALLVESDFYHSAYPKKQTCVTLYEAFKRYLRDINVLKKRAKIERYRIKAWMKSDYKDLKLDQIKTHHLAAWRDQLIKKNYQANTIRLHLAVLSHLFTIAKSEWGFEQLENPVINLKRPKLPKTRSTRITDQDITLLIKNTESKLLPYLIRLALLTGMRRSELIKLHWTDVHWDKKYIHIKDTKNGEDRFIPLTSKIYEIIKSINVHNEKIFNITEHAVTVAFTRALHRSKLTHMSFHTLRHEAITRFFEMGLTIPEVASISGHKSWSMLRRYTHLQSQTLINKLEG